MGDSPWASAHAAAAAAGVSLRPLTSVAGCRRRPRGHDRDLGQPPAPASRDDRRPRRERERAVRRLRRRRPARRLRARAGPASTPAACTSTRTCWPRCRTGATTGSGSALKLAQRAQALEQGMHVVRWTFDPMVARNAWVNLGKLGAVADRFRRDFYGAMTDTLNDGERSDRLVVRWDLDREPGPRSVPDDAATVTVPRDYPDLRERDPEAARAARDETAGRPRVAARCGTASWSASTATAPRTCSPRSPARCGDRRPMRPAGEGRVDRAPHDRPAARAPLPHQLRHGDREGVRPGPGRDGRRRRRLGRGRDRARPRLLRGVERGRCGSSCATSWRPPVFARRRPRGRGPRPRARRRPRPPDGEGGADRRGAGRAAPRGRAARSPRTWAPSGAASSAASRSASRRRQGSSSIRWRATSPTGTGGSS